MGMEVQNAYLLLLPHPSPLYLLHPGKLLFIPQGPSQESPRVGKGKLTLVYSLHLYTLNLTLVLSLTQPDFWE